MMKSYIISRAWFEDIKREIIYKDPFFFTENGTDKVEADFEEGPFNRMSQLKGWV